MYCIHCGTELPDDALFCRSCGKRIDDSKPISKNPATSAVLPRIIMMQSDEGESPDPELLEAVTSVWLGTPLPNEASPSDSVPLPDAASPSAPEPQYLGGASAATAPGATAPQGEATQQFSSAPTGEPAQSSGPAQTGSPAPQIAPSQRVSSTTPVETVSPPEPTRKKSKALPLAIGSAAAAVIVAVLVFAFALPAINGPQDKTAHVSLVLQVPEYDDESSPIPFQVTGTDAEGNKVDEIQTVDSTDASLTLPEGTYTVQPAGSPVNSTGRIYRYESTQTTVIVKRAEAGSSSDNGYIAVVDDVEDGELSSSYDPIPPEQVTDEELEAATSWMSDAGLDADKAGRFIQTVEDATDAAYHVTTDFFELDVPKYWRGKVRWEVRDFQENGVLWSYGGAIPVQVVFYAIPNDGNELQEEQELAIVYASLSDQPSITGDRYSSAGTPVEERGFYILDVEDIWYGGMSPDVPGAAYLVDLQTGGKGTPATGYYQVDKANYDYAKTFFTDNLFSTIKPTLTDEAKAHELLKRAYHVTADYFEFDIPEYWWGKVTWSEKTEKYYNSINADVVTVYCKGGTDYESRLVSISSYPPPAGNPDAWVGTLGAIPVYEVDQNGRRLRITANDPGSIIHESARTPVKAHDAEIIDLNSGGQVTLETLPGFKKLEPRDISKSYLEQQLVPTVKLKY